MYEKKYDESRFYMNQNVIIVSTRMSTLFF